jgi:nucleoside 2-deoxyribosyltransferase
MATNPPTAESVSPVYISGPMFSVADLSQQKLIWQTLKDAGMKMYLPQEDGIEVGPLMAHIGEPGNGVPPDVLFEAVLFVRQIVCAMDNYQLISRCNSLVFNMDGRVPDEGSVAETAAGWASGQAIVIYKTTPITMLGGTDNPMVSGLALTWQTVNKVTLLPQAILDTAQLIATMGATRFTPGTQCAAVIKLGNLVWDTMPTIRGIIGSIDPNDPMKTVNAFLELKAQWIDLLKAAYPVQSLPVTPTGAIDLTRA